MGSISIPFGMIFPSCLSTKPFHSLGKHDLYHCTSSSHKDLHGKTSGKHGLQRYKIASNANHNIRQRGATRQAVDDTICQPWDAAPQLNEGAETVFITKCLTMCETRSPQTFGTERTATQCTMRHHIHDGRQAAAVTPRSRYGVRHLPDMPVLPANSPAPAGVTLTRKGIIRPG